MKNCPLGVGQIRLPTPTGARQTTLPFLTSVARKRRVSIFSHVRTGWSWPRAEARTQPVVPLGRTGSRTCSQAWPAASFVRASTSTRSSVATGERVVSCATAGALASGRARAVAAWSTHAKYDFLPRCCRCSTRAGAAPGAGAATTRASRAAPRRREAERPRTSAGDLRQGGGHHLPSGLDREARGDAALVGGDPQPAGLLRTHME